MLLIDFLVSLITLDRIFTTSLIKINKSWKNDFMKDMQAELMWELIFVSFLSLDFFFFLTLQECFQISYPY